VARPPLWAVAATHLLLKRTAMRIYLGSDVYVDAKSLLEQLRKNGAALLVWFSLAEHARKRGEIMYCWPSLAKIGKDSGLSKMTVRKALNDLERLGLIERSWMQGSGYKSKVTVIKV